MQTLLQYKETRNLLTKIQQHENDNIKFSPNNLNYQNFVLYTLINYNPENHKATSDLILNYILAHKNLEKEYYNEQLKEILKSCFEKELINLNDYYETNKNQIKIDNNNIEILLNKIQHTYDIINEVNRQYKETINEETINQNNFTNFNPIQIFQFIVLIGGIYMLIKNIFHP